MRLRFDSFTLDTDTRQLFSGDREVHLSPKAFDLLAILLDNRPVVVNKEVLRERLWGKTNVVDANLNNLASEIRAALGDDSQHPRFLRTAHRVGYAFCGTIIDASTEQRRTTTLARAPRFWLIWNERTLVLGEGSTILGRDPECPVWIDVPGVSRRHARIQLVESGSGTSAVIEDLGSTNGTFVDKRRVRQPYTLHDGQTIQVGEATLVFRAWSSAAAPTKRIKRR